MESKAFRMNTYKNRGEGGALLLTRFPIRESVLRSIATKDLSSHAAGNVCHVEHRDDGTFRPYRKGSASSSHPTNCVFKGSPKEGDQYDMGPTSFSTSAVSTMTMASHGQPSRKQPSGPLLRHFLQPMHRIGSIWMRPNGGLSSSGTQNMQSSTGQYSTQAGEPAQPVQHSVITASSFGFFLRAVEIPFERGSNFCSSGTNPGAFATSGALAICRDSTFPVKPLSARFFRRVLHRIGACYNARASESSSPAHHVSQTVLQTSLARARCRPWFAALFHLAFPVLFRRYGPLRRAGAQLAVPRRLRLLFPWADSCLRRTRARLSGISRGDLFPGWNGAEGRHGRTGARRPCDMRPGDEHCRSFGGGRS